MTDPRRRLPSVDALLRAPAVLRLLETHPRNLVVAAVRDTVGWARSGAADAPVDWDTEITERVASRSAPSLAPVHNATGVVLHTNLGRAPLATAALEAAVRIGRGYGNLELDLATGSRGSRLDHCAELLAETAGAESAFAVNNAAGALVLALNGLAAGREVVISRGELIEIGGSFRIPDILIKSGAELREVGTTNRTHLADYERALSDRTGAILVVHRSNFAMTGFVSSPPVADLAQLAAARGVPLIHDVGSGLLIDLAEFGLVGEPVVSAATRAADVVIFSGDKLLGGPQAGCIVGRLRWVAPLTKNPFARALRTDKLTLAALEATLALYRDRSTALKEIPVLRMLTLGAPELRRRAERLAAGLPPAAAPTLEPASSAVGGGSFPDASLPTTVVTVDPGSRGAAALALALRLGTPAVLARVDAGRLVLDPRTLDPDDLDAIAGAVAAAIEAA